jgi:bacillithiol biosynthesis cysteine-adding enzyme BshC
MTNVRIVTEPLGGSPLSQLLQAGTAPRSWMDVAPASASEWRERAEKRIAERDWNAVWEGLRPALNATGAAAERLERVQRTGGIVVTTGQQPGLFGGPVYTWSKAMGALAFADALERATGIATAVIFWAATDDADFAEGSYTIFSGTGGAEVVRSDNAPAAGTPMSFALLGDLSSQLERLRSSAGSAADPRPLRVAERAYGNPDATVGDAYVSLMRDMLEPLGIPVLDASHPAVRSASDEILRRALTSAAKIEDALNARTREIRAAYLDPQVVDVGGLSLVFAREGAVKRRLNVAESAAVANAADVFLTPNVLLRPIVEQAILPTVGYLGGPGELAYFAQSSAVADALGVSRPLGLPRWSCTLVEPHVERLLSTFGVTPEALSRPDELEGVVARASMSESTAGTVAELRAMIERLPAALANEAEPLGLGAAVQGATQSLQHRVDRLERRLVAGIKRRETALLRDVGTLRAALYPMGHRQERALNLLPLLSRHGSELLGEMCAAASDHARSLVGSTDPDARS